MGVVYAKHKEFMNSVRDLKQKGGPYQKAAEKVLSVLGIISTCGEDKSDPFTGLRLTKFGENRIDKCIKYDLIGHCRLITIHDNNLVLFCFAGDHDTCDRWLNRNRGQTLIENEHTQIDLLPISSVNGSVERRPSGVSSLTTGKLFKKLQPESYFDKLIDEAPRNVIHKLEALESTNEENEIEEIVKGIKNNEQARAVYDVFSLLRQDNRKEAIDRIKVFLGMARPISPLTDEEILKLTDSEKIKTIPSSDPNYQVLFEHFVKTANYMDWMLFLHPDQKIIVDADYKGPTKLSGVSGSGKTCIVVKRAIRLAEKYSGEKVLVLTLNRQLASLINDMVDEACPPYISRQNIEVMPFFKLCQGLLHQFEPEKDKFYDDTTWKNEEHVDEIWREFYRCELNVSDAEILLPLHDSLLARGVNSEEYIREEFVWLRSAVPHDKRDQYLTIKRSGRGYPLDKNFRQLIIDGLSLWEKKMFEVGVTDYLGLSTALYPYIGNIKSNYRSVVVDETQDFGTIELELIRRLVNKNMNDMFFCGDIAQQVSTKHLSFNEANIDMPSARSLRINKNYRNSREILEAAYNVLNNNLTDEMLDSADFEILDPEYANFSAALPLMLKAGSLEQEIAYSIKYIQEYLESGPSKKGCLSFCGYSLYQIQHFGKKNNIKVLDGELTIGEENIYLSDLEHMKGFEFDVVVIVNCNDHIIPDQYIPEKEQYRDLSKLYVSMTRAKDQLVISFSSQLSQYLSHSKDHFLLDEWAKYYLEEGHPNSLGTPSTLDQIREGEQMNVNPLNMSGPEFLYTHQAMGLSGVLIDKLRNLVPGVSRRRNGDMVEWKAIQNAQFAVEVDPKARRLFGAGLDQFKELLEKLEE